MILSLILVLVALAGLTWRLLPFLSGAAAWLLVAVMALSLLVGVPVPAGAVVLTTALWLTSQLASRYGRRGDYRSTVLRRLAA